MKALGPVRSGGTTAVFVCAAVTIAIQCAACAPTPTYHAQVAPILEEHCVGCHQPGQAAPFSLRNVDEVSARASAIERAVTTRRMPPWLPDRSEPPFVGERRLTADHISLIQRWARNGAPAGRAPTRASVPTLARGWQLGSPDLVLTPAAPYALGAHGGHDVYRNLIVTVPGTATRFVRAMEFETHGAPIHHAVIRVDRRRLSRSREGVDGQPGFEGMAGTDILDPDGHFLGWAPGRGPIVSPDGLPWVLPANSDLVIELHLMPGGQAIDVQPSIALYFTDRAPRAAPVMIVMGSKAIDIPAGAADYEIEDRYTLPVDVEVLSVYPHAHYLGHRVVVDAQSPGGATRNLLRIAQWSFNWQQDYRFATPVALSRGTTLVMRFSYDNSAANPNNPSRPPRRVLWGPGSHDEMGNLGVQMVAANPGDAAQLASSFARHASEIDARGAAVLIAADPTSAAHHTMLGTSLMQLGRYAEAAAAFTSAGALAPQSATVANHLGGALLGNGQPLEALRQFQRAVKLTPGDAHLRFNLAKVHEGLGQSQAAYDHYAVAVSLDPSFGEAHQQLGVMSFGRGQPDEAVRYLRKATALMPESASAHADLGGALAQMGRLTEARQYLTRALELDPSDAVARQNLAHLQALAVKPQ